MRFLLILLLILGCGPKSQLNPKPRQHFVLVIHDDSGTNDEITVEWAFGSTVVHQERRRIIPFQAQVVVMGVDDPDLLTITSIAALSNRSWGRPDWLGHKQVHWRYPSGAYWFE